MRQDFPAHFTENTSISLQLIRTSSMAAGKLPADLLLLPRRQLTAFLALAFALTSRLHACTRAFDSPCSFHLQSRWIAQSHSTCKGWAQRGSTRTVAAACGMITWLWMLYTTWRTRSCRGFRPPAAQSLQPQPLRRGRNIAQERRNGFMTHLRQQQPASHSTRQRVQLQSSGSGSTETAGRGNSQIRQHL